jgi:hypothetical protein
MSAEFTSQIQSEIQVSERETGRAPEGIASGEPAPVASSEDKPPPIKRRLGEELEDVVREGLAPIASLQAELRDTAQKTRQALESIVIEDELEPIADVEAEAENRTTARPTRQAPQSVAESEPEEGQDEASDGEPAG